MKLASLPSPPASPPLPTPSHLPVYPAYRPWLLYPSLIPPARSPRSRVLDPGIVDPALSWTRIPTAIVPLPLHQTSRSASPTSRQICLDPATIPLSQLLHSSHPIPFQPIIPIPSHLTPSHPIPSHPTPIPLIPSHSSHPTHPIPLTPSNPCHPTPPLTCHIPGFSCGNRCGLINQLINQRINQLIKRAL